MDAAEPFNIPVNPVALGIPVSSVSLCISLLHYGGCHVGFIFISLVSAHMRKEICERGGLTM